MKTITIRGIDPGLDQVIKVQAKQSSLSINQWVLKALKKVTGMEKETGVQKAPRPGCSRRWVEQRRSESVSEEH